MARSIPPAFSPNEDNDSLQTPEGRSIGVPGVPSRLIEDFTANARKIQIHVRKGVRDFPVQIIHQGAVYSTDSGLEDLPGDDHGYDDFLDDATLEKLERLNGPDMKEDDLLDIIDTVLAHDKARQVRNRK